MDIEWWIANQVDRHQGFSARSRTLFSKYLFLTIGPPQSHLPEQYRRH